MSKGFDLKCDYQPIIGWELEYIKLQKNHLIFFFLAGSSVRIGLLNVADKCSYVSEDKSISFLYEIYGTNKSINFSRILGKKITKIIPVSRDRLDLGFNNGDILSVYDNPEFRSWWFTLGEIEFDQKWAKIEFSLQDRELEDLTTIEREERLSPFPLA